jgi:hypothetical protein
MDFGFIASHVKDLSKRQTCFMFLLGFKKTLYSFVRNLATIVLECLGTLALSNFWELQQLEFERHVFVDVMKGLFSSHY